MTVISRKRLREFGMKYPDARKPLDVWRKLMEDRDYEHLPDLRSVFPTADQIEKMGNLFCFNIKGNTYRLIVGISFPKTVFVKELLTQDEYNKRYLVL